MAFLRIIEGHGAGLGFELTGQRVTIGRDATNLIQLGDIKASRYHAELVCVDGRYVLNDQGSSNGTWNDRGRITSEPMSHQSVFRIGQTYLRFEDAATRGKSEPTQTGEQEEGWSDPQDITGLDRDGTELFSHRTMVDPRELERSNAFLVLLHQIVLEAAKTKTRDELFELLDDAAADALEGDRCAVFLPTPDGWTLWPTHERRLRARFGATPFARSLLTTVRQRREPLLCTSEGDIDLTTSMVQAGVRSAMAAPLRIGDDIHALLYVDRLGGNEAFTRVELEFLAAVANQLAVQLHNMANVADLQAEVVRLRAEPAKQPPVVIVGKDPAMLAVEQFIAKAAPADAPVLILGESGTGKELVARAIHQRSQRADRPLQIVNCAALGEAAIEAALFGVAAGAGDPRPGLFELADQGTIFLDEVGELPVPAQARLLRAIESREVQRIGDSTARAVDVRVIAATNRDLREEAAAGRFRDDLHLRLEVLAVTLPPLRARPTDIDLLIDHFLDEHARRAVQPAKRLAPEARALVLRHQWPGNVRQLKNALERACIMAGDKLIHAVDLPDGLRGGETQPFTTPLVSLALVEKAHILRVLEHCGGNKKAAAELLEIDRSTLYAKLRQYGTI
ncbi:MAG TPA: sigma 54-interacting transcriptional regulator [Planctomycetota bacterium]|nr:sigma 54-interacting transcriptional regulator [Planctomycetota bacterium]